MFSCYLHIIFLVFQKRSVTRNKRSEFNYFDNSEDDQSRQSQTSGSSTHIEKLIENNVSAHTWCFLTLILAGIMTSWKFLPCQTEEILISTKKSWGRGRTESHSLVQNPSGHGLLSQSQQQQGAVSQSENSIKPTPQSSRMPDGTRGFTIGRGKPLSPAIGGPVLTVPVGLGPIQVWIYYEDHARIFLKL